MTMKSRIDQLIKTIATDAGVLINPDYDLDGPLSPPPMQRDFEDESAFIARVAHEQRARGIRGPVELPTEPRKHALPSRRVI